MEGTYLSIEDAKTIENYDKLYAENTMLKSNELNFKRLRN